MITLVFADDHAIARAGIRTILSQAPDIHIAGEATNADDVPELVDKFRPKILLLDLKMPGRPTADIEKWVRINCPETVTLVLTAHDRDAYLTAMIDSGAVGLIDKNDTGEKLIEAIRRAAGGEILFDKQQLGRALRWRETAGKKWVSLSERELQVLKLLVQGLDRIQTADVLKITPRTVDYHIANILKKLDVKSHKDAVCWVHKYISDDLGSLI